jgi:hypothetical protein
MTTTKYFLGLLVIALVLNSCAKSRIKGLWVADRVYAGSTDLSPKARWIRIDKKNVQESGNGWQKHSIGTWELKRKKLTLVNSNGFTDPYEPFEVKFVKNGMEWIRHENDKRVKVLFTKIEEIPLSERDKLLGVWDLKTVLEDGKDLTLKYNVNRESYLFMRWDNMFELKLEDERTSGIYRIGGFLDEIELVYNTTDGKRQTFNFQIKNNRLVLTSVNSEIELIIEFIRTDRFPGVK